MTQTTIDEGRRFGRVSVEMLIFFLISVIIIFHHFFFLSNVVTNIPTWDDYDLVLRFLNDYATSDNLTEKIELILKRHNEHRVVETRILSLLQWKLTGQVNFKTLTIIGNCQLIFLLALLVFHCRSRAQSWYCLWPFPLIIFNFNSIESMIWTTTSVTNFAVLLFALIGIMILHYKSFTYPGFSLRFWLALVFTIMATISGGVGFLSLIICAFSLWISRAPKIYSIAWSVIMIVTLVLHFNDPETSSSLGALQQSTTDLWVVISRFIIMTGNFFNIYGASGYYTVLVMGSFMILGFGAYVLLEKPWVTNPTLFFSLIFLFGSSAIIALGRISEGEMQAFASRYVIFSTLITAFIFSMLMEMISKEKLKYLVTAFLVVTLYLFFQAYVENASKARAFRAKHEQGAYSYNNQWTTSLYYPDQNIAVAVIEKSRSLGIYSLPGGRGTFYNSELIAPPTSSIAGNIKFNIEGLYQENEFSVISGWAFIHGATTSPATIGIILMSQDRTYKKTCIVFGRRDVQEYFKEGPDNSGFRVVFFGDEIKEGTYHIGFEIEQAGIKYLDYSGKFITIKN